MNDKKHGKGVHTTKHHKYIEEWKEGELIDRKGEDSRSPTPNFDQNEVEYSATKFDKSPATPTKSESSNHK